MTTKSASAAVPVLERDRTSAPRAPSFGFNPSMKRRKPYVAAPGDKSDQELIDEFLKTRQVTVAPPRYADGSVPTSGDYDFGQF